MNPGMRRPPRLGEIQLADERLFLTKNDNSSNPADYLIGPTEIPGGEWVEDLQVRWVARNVSTNFRVVILGEYSNDKKLWSPFGSAIITEQSNTALNINSAAYTTRPDFGRFLRFTFRCYNSTGSALENGVYSVWVAIKTWSM